MDKRLNQFEPRSGFGVTGASLDKIANVCAEIYGEKEIRIVLPYHNFNCYGKATEIAKDVDYLMPFHGGDVCGQDETTTLFYGDTKVNRGTYLPFQSDADVFFLSAVSDVGIPTILLMKAPCWRAYI